MKRQRMRLILALLIPSVIIVSGYFAFGFIAYRQKSLLLVEQGPAFDLVASDQLSLLLNNAVQSHSDAIVIFKDGILVGEWNTSTTPQPIEAMSVTKSIVSTVIARAITLGKIESLDIRVHEIFPEWNSDTHREITLRHILTHRTGLECHPNTQRIYRQQDFVRFALEANRADLPNTTFQYNNRQTNLLPAIVENYVATDFDTFFKSELLEPLGIKSYEWEKDSVGNAHGMAGLKVTPRDLATFGLLLLNDGKFRGEQIIDESLVQEMLSPGSDSTKYHGLLWWLKIESGELVAAYGDGYLGQYLVVIPKSGIVAVRMYNVNWNHWFTYNEADDGYGHFVDDVIRLCP